MKNVSTEKLLEMVRSNPERYTGLYEHQLLYDSAWLKHQEEVVGEKAPKIETIKDIPVYFEFLTKCLTSLCCKMILELSIR